MKIPEVQAGIKTNLIAGAGRADRQALVLHVLKDKPVHERWAVLLSSSSRELNPGDLQENEHQGVYLATVEGGCFCCSTPLVMQRTLNHLLLRSKPQRLLVELATLAHSTQVLKLLTQPWYTRLLALKATVGIAAQPHDPAACHDAQACADVLATFTHDAGLQQDAATMRILLRNPCGQFVRPGRNGTPRVTSHWLDMPCGYVHVNEVWSLIRGPQAERRTRQEIRACETSA